MTLSDSFDLASALERDPGGRPIDQVGFLVQDLPTAMSQWSALCRDDEWRVYTYGPQNVEDLSYRGDVGQFSMRLALLGSGPQIELIQPLHGPSIYHDWIDNHGFGLHHFGFFVPSVADAIKELEAGGHLNIQSGSGYGLDRDGGFAYFDFEDAYGIHLEAIEVPTRRRPSETLV